MSRGLVTVTLSLAAAARVAAAQPAAAPPPPPPPALASAPPAVPDLGEAYAHLHAGFGFAHYAEHVQDTRFEARPQPFVIVNGELGLRAGRAMLVLQLSAALGTEVDMQATQGGAVVQENRFWQEIYEASPRVRWPLTPRVHLDAGYRLTIQRLHIIEIPGLGDALEVVTVHALEAGFGWERRDPDGRALAFDLAAGLNRGAADNDRIEGDHFTAPGFSLSTRLTRRWPSGLTVGGAFQIRKQDGSAVEHVTFDGMQTDAVWPANTTYSLVADGGFRF